MVVSRSVALVGLPGAGKSTVGKLLSKKLGMPFVDSDQELEKRLGVSIRDYFAAHGEAAFRAQESQTLADLALHRGPCILSTGGGIVLAQANRDVLRTHTTVVYLRSAPADLYARLKHDTTRPLLQVADPLAKLQELHAQRDPLYREVASFAVETARSSVGTLVNKIVMQLELAN